jgi:hypothetical protein
MCQSLFGDDLAPFVDGLLVGKAEGGEHKSREFGNGALRQGEPPHVLYFILEHGEDHLMMA